MLRRSWVNFSVKVVKSSLVWGLSIVSFLATSRMTTY